jgi:two-component system, OmpR family, response regulator
MKIKQTNIFIVDDDKIMVTSLKQSLEKRFGEGVRIKTFNNGESCLKNVDETLDIVILDYFMKNKNGLEVLKSIKTINPKTEVIMLTGNDDVVIAIESLRAGAKDYLAKGPGSESKITKMVNYIITHRFRIMSEKFNTLKSIILALTILIALSLIVFWVIRVSK